MLCCEEIVCIMRGNRGHLTSFSSSFETQKRCKKRNKVKDICGDRSGSFVVIFRANLGGYLGK